jgi:hypothetical protein
MGWPAWSGTAAGAIFLLFTRRLAEAADATSIYYIGVAAFLGCVAILTFGRRIERTLELMNWVLVATILGSFLVLAVVFVPGRTWAAAVTGLAGYDLGRGIFDFLPVDTDLFLLGALAAYSGAGGVVNITLSNWVRDRGYGMGERAGYIPCAIGGQKVALDHNGFMFGGDTEGMRRWNGWWRIVRADQWGVFFTGAILGMILPAMIYVTFLPLGTDIEGFGISAALAQAISGTSGVLIGGVIAFLGAWILFKTQLDALKGMVRDAARSYPTRRKTPGGLPDRGARSGRTPADPLPGFGDRRVRRPRRCVGPPGTRRTRGAAGGDAGRRRRARCERLVAHVVRRQSVFRPRSVRRQPARWQSQVLRAFRRRCAAVGLARGFEVPQSQGRLHAGRRGWSDRGGRSRAAPVTPA